VIRIRLDGLKCEGVEEVKGERNDCSYQRSSDRLNLKGFRFVDMEDTIRNSLWQVKSSRLNIIAAYRKERREIVNGDV